MQWLNSLVSEYEGRPLQKTGMLTKEQLTQFFQESARQFNNPEFKQLLSVANKARGSGAVEEAINGMQREIFHSIGVQGDFGLKCLAKVNQVYTDDAVFLRQFYEHVQKEEMVMDEAEMPEALFKSKYETLNRFREDMEARMSKMKDMSPEEQAAYMSQVYKEILAQSIGADECCSNPHGCSHRHHHGAAGPQPPAAQGAPSVALVPGAAGAQAAQPPVAAGPSVASAMTEAEQLDFFSSLSNTSGKP